MFGLKGAYLYLIALQVTLIKFYKLTLLDANNFSLKMNLKLRKIYFNCIKKK